MKKGLIIALAAMLVLGLAGGVSAFDGNAGVFEYGWAGPGASVQVSGSFSDADPEAPCQAPREYTLGGNAGILNNTGETTGYVFQFGIGSTRGCKDKLTAWMTTDVGELCGDGGVSADLIWAQHDLSAEICQKCETTCPGGCPVDLYEATTSLWVEDGGVQSAHLTQGTNVEGPFTQFGHTTGQTLEASGYGGEDLGYGLVGYDGLSVIIDMSAERFVPDGNGWVLAEDHTMGIYLENAYFNVDEAFQGMTTKRSRMYGYFDGIICYSSLDGGSLGCYGSCPDILDDDD